MKGRTLDATVTWSTKHEALALKNNVGPPIDSDHRNAAELCKCPASLLSAKVLVPPVLTDRLPMRVLLAGLLLRRHANGRGCSDIAGFVFALRTCGRVACAP